MTFGDWQQGLKPLWGENEWLTSCDPSAMLDFLGKEAAARKLRLFAVACCRRIWDVITTELHRDAVELAERLADGMCSEQEYRKMLKELEKEYNASIMECHVISDPVERLRQFRYDTLSFQETARWTLYKRWDMPWTVSYQAACLRAGRDEAFDIEHGVGRAANMTDEQREKAMTEWQCRFQQEREAQSRLIRDLFGNPFQQRSAQPKTVSDRAKSFAYTIYEGHEFAAMPVLADLLEEEGLLEIPVLDHCRSHEVHVRGCWVIDLLLDRWGEPPPSVFSWQ